VEGLRRRRGVAGLVTATNALDALDQCPPRASVYVGGPSDAEPDRPWWADEHQGCVRENVREL